MKNKFLLLVILLIFYKASTADAASDDAGAAGTATARESRQPQRVTFEFKDSNAQTQMSIAGETTYDYKYIVMPLRI